MSFVLSLACMLTVAWAVHNDIYATVNRLNFELGLREVENSVLIYEPFVN